MAITVTSPPAKVGFIVNGVSADASGGETLLAGTAGKKIKIRSIVINSGAALTVTVGQGLTGNAVTLALIGPISFGANTSFDWTFNPLLELASGTALTLDASGAGAVCVVAQGLIE